MDQRSHPIPVAIRALDNLADLGSIGIADFGSGGVAGEVGDEGTGESGGIACEEGIQIIRAAERSAIGEGAARVHFRTELVLHAPVGFAFFGWFIALAVGAVAIT